MRRPARKTIQVMKKLAESLREAGGLVEANASGGEGFTAAERRKLLRVAAELLAVAMPAEESTEPIRRKVQKNGRSLTRRELEVAKFIAKGLSDNDVAAALGISPRTVHSHRDNVLGKLGVQNRAGVATWVRKNLVFPAGVAIPALEVFGLVGL